MKKSVFAKLLILVLCFALMLCGCGESADTAKSDGGEGTSNESNQNQQGGNVQKPETPEEKAEAALERTLSAMFASSTDMSALEKALQCGKITVTVGDYVDNVLYMNTNKLEFVDQLSLNIEGVELDVEVYLNEHDVVLALPEVVDGAYGVSLDTIVNDLPDSAIWELLGVDYEEFMSELATSLEGMTGDLDELSGMLEGMSAPLSGLEDALTDVLSNVNKTVAEGKASVDGKDVDAVIVTYSADSAAMQKMVNILLDWYAEYVESMSDYLAAYVEQGAFEAADIAEMIESAKGEVATFFENADLTLEFTVNVNAKTGYIMTAQGAFSGTVEGEEGGVYLNIDLGENLTESDKYTFELNNGEDENVLMAIDRDVQGSKSEYTLSISMAEDGNDMELMTASLSYDSSSYAYEITLEAEGEKLAANGTFKLTDKDLELTIASIEAAGETTKLDILFGAEAIAPSDVPAAPKYANLLTMSEDDLMMLLLNISAAFQ
ncbi:MAG: hypothetical protein E7466_00060 [Ruminococcaceae bacterium]|nr:hypothetical protein [Oscillospiraceae bacterium]